MQVAGQQGAYLAHLVNSGHTLGVGGYTQPPPFRVVQHDRMQVGGWVGARTEREQVIRWRTDVRCGEAMQAWPHFCDAVAYARCG